MKMTKGLTAVLAGATMFVAGMWFAEYVVRNAGKFASKEDVAEIKKEINEQKMRLINIGTNILSMNESVEKGFILGHEDEVIIKEFIEMAKDNDYMNMEKYTELRSVWYSMNECLKDINDMFNK